MRARIFSAILLGLSALLTAAPMGTAQAQDTPAQYAPVQYYGPPPGYGGPGNGVQPLDRLLPGIRRAHPGEFYDAEGPTYGPEGDPHYHLKWMTPDGRVIWYDTDARSGRVLRSSPGRDSFEFSSGAPAAGIWAAFCSAAGLFLWSALCSPLFQAVRRHGWRRALAALRGHHAHSAC